jgi:hypothetical protein
MGRSAEEIKTIFENTLIKWAGITAYVGAYAFAASGRAADSYGQSIWVLAFFTSFSPMMPWQDLESLEQSEGLRYRLCNILQMSLAALSVAAFAFPLLQKNFLTPPMPLLTPLIVQRAALWALLSSACLSLLNSKAIRFLDLKPAKPVEGRKADLWSVLPALLLLAAPLMAALLAGVLVAEVLFVCVVASFFGSEIFFAPSGPTFFIMAAVLWVLLAITFTISQIRNRYRGSNH